MCPKSPGKNHDNVANTILFYCQQTVAPTVLYMKCTCCSAATCVHYPIYIESALQHWWSVALFFLWPVASDGHSHQTAQNIKYQFALDCILTSEPVALGYALSYLPQKILDLPLSAPATDNLTCWLTVLFTHTRRQILEQVFPIQGIMFLD